MQDILVEKDFNIVAEAPGVVTPVVKKFNANVTENILEIRFYWAGKGTVRIPATGVYGPLISAISVDPNFIPRSEGGKARIALIIVGVVVLCLIFLALGIIWWRRYFKAKTGKEKDLKGLELQTGSFSLKQLNVATNSFDPANKIGEGGFGPVYKACQLQQTGSLMELVDQKLGSEFNKVEAERMIKVAFLCTDASPSIRPTMSEVVSMLEGISTIPEMIPEASSYSKDLRFKAIRDRHSQMQNQSLGGSQAHCSTSVDSWNGSSSTSAHDLYEITDESHMRVKAIQAQISMSVSSQIDPSSASEEDLYQINSKSTPIGLAILAKMLKWLSKLLKVSSIRLCIPNAK